MAERPTLAGSEEVDIEYTDDFEALGEQWSEYHFATPEGRVSIRLKPVLGRIGRILGPNGNTARNEDGSPRVKALCQIVILAKYLDEEGSEA